MKKITLLLILLAGTFAMHAQLPDNTPAPDFTATDLNGNTHTLSSYLNDGKTVILEISDTGCGPCWKYKQTQALQDLYNAFGPPGSNELMVLQIEDYSYETYDSAYNKLHGITGTGSSGFGNWVEGTPFPIILSNTINDSYEINYFPTFYRICPAGTTKLIGQYTPYYLKSILNANCGAMAGVPNYARVLETENGFCTTQGSFRVKFKNYGSNDITQAVFKLKENGVMVATKIYTGNAMQFNAETISFDEVAINIGSQYTVDIESVNGVTNFNAEFSHANLPFHISVPSEVNLQVKIHANDHPENISWSIYGTTGVVAGGGPYPAPDSNTYNTNTNAIIEHNITLPTTDGCYTLNLASSDGYGWRKWYWGTPLDITPGVEIFSEGQLLYSNLSVGNFGNNLTIENFLSVGMLDNEEAAVTGFSIYPNPSAGIFNVSTQNPVDIVVYDLLGHEVFSRGGVDNSTQINLSQYSNGIYVVKVTTEDNHIHTQKIILQD